MKQSKTYEYEAETVKDSLLKAFKARNREATVADLVTVTALPKIQVEEQLAPLSDEYGARLKVTESGEVLYSFPDGFKSRYRGFGPAAKRFFKLFKKGAITAGTWAFKAWIAVTLVGYFALFIALAVVAFLASIAASAATNKDGERSSRSGDSGFGLALSMRVIDMFIRLWFYSELFKSPQDRYRQAARKQNQRPLHKAVFSFVFGDGDPNADWAETARKAVIAFVQGHKGLITLTEFAAITGYTLTDAEREIMPYLVEFDGSPEVTENGTMYFRFPSLMRTSGTERGRTDMSPVWKKQESFSSNPKGMNAWFGFFNAVNVAFSTYFLAFSSGLADNLLRDPLSIVYRVTWALLGEAGMANPDVIILSGLGLFPLAFSFMFFLVPFLRKLSLAARNERTKTDNLRAAAWQAVLRSPASAESGTALALFPGNSLVAASKAPDEKASATVMQELAAQAGGEPVAADGGGFTWTFKELERQAKDIADTRTRIDVRQYETGSVVFDSHDTATRQS